MSLANIAYAATLGWGNPTMTTLEAQALVPMFGEAPVELGLSVLTESELLDVCERKSDIKCSFLKHSLHLKTHSRLQMW